MGYEDKSDYFKTFSIYKNNIKLVLGKDYFERNGKIFNRERNNKS